MLTELKSSVFHLLFPENRTMALKSKKQTNKGIKEIGLSFLALSFLIKSILKNEIALFKIRSSSLNKFHLF